MGHSVLQPTGDMRKHCIYMQGQSMQAVWIYTFTVQVLPGDGSITFCRASESLPNYPLRQQIPL